LQDKLGSYFISKKEKVELFNIVWYNSRKLGLVFIGSYAINKFSLFLAGLYLPLSDIASYGLMLQLFGLVSAVSGTFFSINQSHFSVLRINGKMNELLKEFAYSMNLYYMLFILGAFFIIFTCPLFLTVIGANAKLPSLLIMSVFAVIALLEGNHSNFSTLIVIKNEIPFVKPSLIAGGAIILGDYFSLTYTGMGIFGLVLLQGLVQITYANWKWPYVVCKDFGVNFLTFIAIGMQESLIKLRREQ
jgi:hypothetical protein